MITWLQGDINGRPGWILLSGDFVDSQWIYFVRGFSGNDIGRGSLFKLSWCLSKARFKWPSKKPDTRNWEKILILLSLRSWLGPRSVEQCHMEFQRPQ